MLTFEEFEKYINYLKRSSEYQSQMYSVARKYSDVICDFEQGVIVADDYIVELLEKLFTLKPDESGYTTLSWWIYETEFGEKKNILESFELGYLPEEHPYRHPKLDTVRELYDYLLFEMSEATEKA